MMELIAKHLCMTKDIGVQNNLFGGIMLSYLDSAGAIYASEQIKNKAVVTKKFSEVIFKRPVKVHDIIHIFGKITKIGTSSIDILLEARTYDPSNGEENIVCETTATFVHIGEDGKSKSHGLA